MNPQRGKEPLSIKYQHKGITLHVHSQPAVIELGGTIENQEQADKAIAWLEALRGFMADGTAPRAPIGSQNEFPDEGI